MLCLRRIRVGKAKKMPIVAKSGLRRLREVA